MIKVGVLGAGGRMGPEVCRAVTADPEMELVAAVDPKAAGAEAGPGLVVGADLSQLEKAGAEVAVDFTTPGSVMDNVRWCLAHSTHAVVGTTGLSAADLEELRKACEGSSANVLIAPNFAIGAVLMMRFSEIAAASMPHAEIVELHHEGKLDSPSGTAIKTAERINRGRPGGAARPTEAGTGVAEQTLPGARGAENKGVHIHSVRLPGLVAHQEVIFGGPGQTLTIRHDTTDRTAFMPGVLLAVREVANHPGLTVGLEDLLDI